MSARTCTCGGKSLLRVGPAAPPFDLKDWSWGCTPTGAFRCANCGVIRKFRLEEGEPRDIELVPKKEA